MTTDTQSPDLSDPPADDGAIPDRRRRPWWHWALRIVAMLVLAAVVVAVLHNDLPSPKAVWSALRHAAWGWVVTALVLELASIAMLIRQQRRLLRAFGVPMTLGRMGAITYSSTALSMSMPAGGAVGAGYSYHQYRANGASPATAASVLLLSGVLSVVGLVLLYLAGFGLAVGSPMLGLGQRRPILLLAIGAAVLAVIILTLTLLARRNPPPPPDQPAPTPRLDAYGQRHPKLGRALRQVLDTVRQAGRIDRHNWRLTLTTSAANWALDAISLYAACRAVHAHIGILDLGAIYLGIQLVRQIPITPGGIGVIEATLLAALVAQGVPTGAASGAVLIYRLFSAWLIVPIGYVFLATLRRRKKIPAAAGAT